MPTPRTPPGTTLGTTLGAGSGVRFGGRRVGTLGAGAAAAVLAGCFGSLPARELYRLRPPTAAGATPADRSGADPAPSASNADIPVLAVEPYTTPGVYAGAQIVYRVGEAQYGTYPTREWALPLGGMLATLTTQSVATMEGGAGRVQDGRQTGPARGLVWRGVVREFEEVDRGRRVTAAVWLDAQLVRAADDSVLWTGSAQLEQNVSPPDAMTAVVDALSTGAQRAVADLVRQAAPAMRAAGRSVAARR